MKTNKKSIIGWIGILITVTFSSIWAYWGSIENFHEGWYSTSIWENLFMLVFQYLLFTVIFIFLAVIILKWKRIGLILHLTASVVGALFFSGAHITTVGFLIVIPILILGLVNYFGDPKPKKWAYRLLIGIPLTIIVVVSIPQGIKVSQRINDHNLGMRTIEGNDVTLVSAPRGPGWPDEGTSWDEAIRVCKYLSEDGLTMMEEEQNIWRLPTVDEMVRSMMLHGKNAGGLWDSSTQKASYDVTPDKESPLWDVHSKVIYYWSSDVSINDHNRAYIIVYHGGVFDRLKTEGQDYLSFRAVKNVDVE